MAKRKKIHAYLAHKRVQLFGFIFILLLGISLLSLGIYKIFALSEIVVVGSGIELIVDEATFPKNLLFLSPEKISFQLEKRYPQFQNVTIEKHWPRRLVVHMSIRESFVTLLSQGDYYAIATDGTVIAKTQPNSVQPVLEFDTHETQEGVKLTDIRIAASLALLENVKDTISISHISEWDSASLQVKVDTMNILIANDANISQKADTLQTLITGFRMKGILPTVIDLRYEKPIITK